MLHFPYHSRQPRRHHALPSIPDTADVLAQGRGTAADALPAHTWHLHVLCLHPMLVCAKPPANMHAAPSGRAPAHTTHARTHMHAHTHACSQHNTHTHLRAQVRKKGGGSASLRIGKMDLAAAGGEEGAAGRASTNAGGDEGRCMRAGTERRASLKEQ